MVLILSAAKGRTGMVVRTVVFSNKRSAASKEGRVVVLFQTLCVSDADATSASNKNRVGDHNLVACTGTYKNRILEDSRVSPRSCVRMHPCRVEVRSVCGQCVHSNVFTSVLQES